MGLADDACTGCGLPKDKCGCVMLAFQQASLYAAGVHLVQYPCGICSHCYPEHTHTVWCRWDGSIEGLREMLPAVATREFVMGHEDPVVLTSHYVYRQHQVSDIVSGLAVLKVRYGGPAPHTCICLYEINSEADSRGTVLYLDDEEYLAIVAAAQFHAHP